MTQSDAVYGTRCPSLPTVASVRKQYYQEQAENTSLSLMARRHFARLADKCTTYQSEKNGNI